MLRTPPRLPLAAAAVAASMMIAACGSSSSGSAGPSSTFTAAQIRRAEQQALSFADCMRSHGVPDFPDSPYDQKHLLSGSGAQTPAVQSAEAACIHLLPNGGQSQSEPHSQTQTAAMLAFARCIRSRGFPGFPDPTSTGQLTHEMLATAGINLNQPAVVQAGDACVSVTHGIITKAIVARFVAGH